ncbi:MAG TPA: carbohydrate kinase [Bacteroidales bacterium]|nr:carbohydrate kinase [Bacteroidales bacterium]
MISNNYNYGKSKKKKILCIGEILWDLLPEGAKVGGAPLNVALHLRNFGFEVKFAGRIGKDQPGYDLKSFIEKQGLDSELLQIDNELETSTVKVELEPNNQVRFEIVDNVAWDRIEFSESLRKEAEQADVIIYGTLASRHLLTRQTVIDIIDINNGLKFIDVNLRAPYNNKDIVEQLIRKATIVKLNNDELRLIAGWYNKNYNESDLAEWFCEKYPCEILCVTRGDKGAFLYNNGKYFEHQGFKVDVKDTVGSGDAFLAGFLSKYLSGDSLNLSLEYACATGALVATKAGGTPSYKESEISRIIQLR